MSLKGKILDDVKGAMKAGEKERLKVLRLITAAIKQVEVDESSDAIQSPSLSRVIVRTWQISSRQKSKLLLNISPNNCLMRNSMHSSKMPFLQPGLRVFATWARLWAR